jgi:molecular chaperone GrpE
MHRRDKHTDKRAEPLPTTAGPPLGAAGAEDAYARGAMADAADPPGLEAPVMPAAASAVPDSQASPELQEQREKYLRLAAEYDNYRKRTMRERQEAAARGQAEMVRHLIDPLDDLSRFAHLDAATVDAATVVHGAELVERKLRKVLATAGLEVIDPVDQAFDPALHEAIATEPALSPEDDHVVARVYQPGYVFAGQLLRPARVVVKQWNG